MLPDLDFIIRVSYVHPSIPVRSFDWLATVDGQEESQLCGTASTPFEAVRELLNKIEEI